MMRLSPPAKRRLRQANCLDMFFGGSEANVSAALAGWGLEAAHVTAFPDTEIGRSAAAFFRGYGVNVDHCVFTAGRMGLYFVENGAMARGAHVIYDREHSAFSEIDEDSFDWNEILKEADWFHWTGITPAVSEGAARCLKKALRSANEKGIIVSADINYRSNLWKWGKDPDQVMPELIALSHIVVAGENDTRNSCGIQGKDGEESFTSISRQLVQRFPGIQMVLTTERDQISASQNKLQAKLWAGDQLCQAGPFLMDNIVERIGSGDAFMAGFIYRHSSGETREAALRFGLASAVSKHSIEGDINCCRLEDIMQIEQGDVSGRLKR